MNKKNKEGYTLFHIACEKNRINIIEYLINNNLLDDEIIKIKNNDDNTGLHLACKKENIDIIKILLSYGKLLDDCCDEQNIYGYTPLHYICIIDLSEHINNSIEILKLFFQYESIIKKSTSKNYPH